MAETCCGRSVKGRWAADQSGTTVAAAHASKRQVQSGWSSSVQCKGAACQCTFAAVQFRLFALALLACSGPKQEPFSWPRNIDDVRARLLVYIRSEEHTSELQSRSDLVCRLLLEKNTYHNLRYLSSLSQIRCS